MSLLPTISPAIAPVLEFLQEAENGTNNLSTYTFTGQNFGAAHASRRLICVVCGQSSGTSSRTVTSATIGGVSATIHVQADDPTGNDMLCAIISASVPTGTSGTVSVTFSAGLLFCGIGLYRALNLVSATPYDIGGDIADPINMVCDIPNGGVLVSGAVFNSTTALATTGVTEDYDAVIDANRRFGMGSASKLAAETNRSISFDGGTAAAAGVCASWR